jgi:hypothetical protein
VPFYALIIAGSGELDILLAIGLSVERLQTMLELKGAPTVTLLSESAGSVLDAVRAQFRDAATEKAYVGLFFIGHANQCGEWILPDRALSVSEILGLWAQSPARSLAILSDCCFAGMLKHVVAASNRTDVCVLTSSAPDEVRLGRSALHSIGTSLCPAFVICFVLLAFLLQRD